MAITKIQPSNIDMDALMDALAERGLIANVGVNHALASMDDSGEMINGANTVDNALNLYSKNRTVSAYDVVTNDELANILLTQSTDSSEDILSLRSEVYSLANSLSKNNTLFGYHVEHGFIDSFNQYDPRCATPFISEISAITDGDSVYTNTISMPLEHLNEINIGAWYAIRKINNDASEEYDVVMIVDAVATDSSVNITLDKDISANNINNIELFAVCGQYSHNTFSFSNTEYDYVSNNSNEISFDDDSSVISASSIDNSGNECGFAFSCRIPANKVGAIKTLTLYGSSSEVASPLQCYILKDSDRADNVNDVISRYNNGDENIIGRSNKVSISNSPISTWSDVNKITFNFDDNGRYNTILDNDTYLFVIVPTDPTILSSFKLLFSKNADIGDVQTNNKCYSYIKDGIYYEFITTDHNYDLMYSIATGPVINEKETPFISGVYNSEQFILNNSCKNLELDLTIAREGYFTVSSSRVTNSDTPIQVSSPNGDYSIFKTGETIVIGADFATITKCDNNLIYIDKELVIEKDVPVYRIGYSPVVTLYSVNEAGALEKTSHKLKLVKINKVNYPSYYSDKLIFKITDDLLDTNKVYKKGELSIGWKSSRSTIELDDEIGRIYNLAITTSNA